MYNSIIVLNKTDENGEVPVDVYEISQIFNIDLSCYPNPFNSDINILCTLKEPSKKIQLSIYNIKGQLVKELFSKQRLEKGKYSVLWNGKNSKNLQVSSGLYFIILKKDNRIIQTKKIIKIGG
ncbi:MAG: T9SS type A sorting domain-containing protein [Candidatus Cloacimonetes bacterium]|nr:T9SS type A sorting domain-containing protein [Candidatus Cloacimonadota bacterium]